MNPTIKRIYFTIRRIAPFWPACKALKQAKKSYRNIEAYTIKSQERRAA